MAYYIGNYFSLSHSFVKNRNPEVQKKDGILAQNVPYDMFSGLDFQPSCIL